MMAKKSKPRLLLYSHDTFGLGHLRRSLSIAQEIAIQIPRSHQLLVTGSMVAGAFSLPPRLDMIKLPAISKRSSGQYKTRTLPLTLRQTVSWREETILQAAINFKPHMVLVDKVAAGVQGELLPTLRHLRTWSPNTKIVLGMRDIEDSPDVTKREWEAEGVPLLLDEVYDRILFYGRRDLFDPVTSYDMSPSAASKIVECGYFGRVGNLRGRQAVRRELGLEAQHLVVVTVGGGGDGFDIIQTYLEMLSNGVAADSYFSLIVTGPLMPQAKRRLLRRRAAALPASLIEFTPDLASYLDAADLVVSMAGYNTVCEILALKKRAILIPRARVRAEQRIRATMLAERGLAKMLPPEELSPDRLSDVIEASLNSPPSGRALDLDGLRRITKAVDEILNDTDPAPSPHPNTPRISVAIPTNSAWQN